jgi:tryptophanyl-tRNA synthetase
LKQILVSVLDEFIAPIRKRREYYLENMDIVVDAIEKGSQHLRIQGAEMLLELREAM